MNGELILSVLNLSFAGSVAILIVLALRLLLCRAPKIFSYALWSVVLFRLLCPISFESTASILPTRPAPIPMDIAMQVTPKVETSLSIVNEVVNASLPSAAEAQATGTSVNPLQIWIGIGEALWLFGILALLIYSVFSLLRLKKRLTGARAIAKRTYCAEGIDSPFVLGVFAPKIYLPVGLSVQEQDYILLHERTHIRRLDHIVKLIAFAALTLHWFNPLVWLAFFLLTRDMEMSCDEAVIRKLGEGVKRDYSTSLLTLATGRRKFSPTPLAFGEGDTKSRISHVLNYKKPAFWLAVLALLLVVTTCVTLALDPPGAGEFPENTYHAPSLLYDAPRFSPAEELKDAPIFHLAADREVYRLVADGTEWTPIGRAYEVNLSQSELLAFFEEASEPLRTTLQQTRTVYRVDSEAKDDSNLSIFYFFFPQKDGSLLLAQGYDRSDDAPYARVLWKYKPQIDLAKAKQLWAYRSEDAVNTATFGDLLSELQLPDGLRYNSYAVKREEDGTNAQLTINLLADEGWRTLDGDWKPLKPRLSTLRQSYMQRNAALLLTLLAEPTEVSYSITEKANLSHGVSFNRIVRRSELSSDYYARAASLSGFREVLAEIAATPPYGIAATQFGDGTAFYTAMEAAIKAAASVDLEADLTYTNHSLPYTESSYRRTESGERIEMLRVVLWASTQHYTLLKDEVRLRSGGMYPVLMHFDLRDGGYELREYHEGEEVLDRVSEETSTYLQDEKEYESLSFSKQAYASALESGKLDASLAIDKLLTAALAGDASAKANLSLFGKALLSHCYPVFLAGDQGTAREQLMYELCKPMLENDISNMSIDTELQGRAWFEALLAALTYRLAEHGREQLQTMLSSEAQMLLELLPD